MIGTEIVFFLVAIGVILFLFRDKKESTKESKPTPVPTEPKQEVPLDFSSMKVAELKSHIKAKGKTKGLPTKKADLVSLAKKLGDQEIK